MWKNYKFQVPGEKKVRYIIHTDAANEADDQFTIAHVLMTDKVEVRGIIAGHFHKFGAERFQGKTMQASYREIEKILKLMHLEGQYSVYQGANDYLKDFHTPIVSEGARFIIEEAMREDERPLYIGMQGAITDLACAILMEPKICERMTCIWVGGGSYPKGESEYNLANDVIAANVVFRSGMPLWQIPNSCYRQFSTSLAELQHKVEPYGKIGSYLFEQLAEFNLACAGMSDWPHGEMWNLGDEGAIMPLLEEAGKVEGYTWRKAPDIDLKDMHYIDNQENREIRVYHELNARLALEDLFAKLAINFPERES